MCRFLVILIGVMLIAGCRGGGGGGSGSGSSYSGGYYSSSGSSYSGGYTGGGSDFASIGSGEAAAASVNMNPEPSTLALFGIGLVGLAYSMFRKKKR